MASIETDYLVVGAGATGMAFTDTLIAESDADVVMVDRRHAPGGHWNDDYPFIRLHQPSAYYGVDSVSLGADRVDDSGPNEGFYERASGTGMRHYYEQALGSMQGSGRVRFIGSSEFVGGGDGQYEVASRLSGETSTIKVRRKLVDATLLQTEIPSRHQPKFDYEENVKLLAPNDLTNLADPGSGFTIIGAGKTAMDTVCWLREQGVEPEAIRWIRTRDPWVIPRRLMQPLDKVASVVEWMVFQLEAASEAVDGADFIRRVEASGAAVRLDPLTPVETFRGATISDGELEALREVDNVVRLGRVLSIGATQIKLEQGTISTDESQIHVDCTASGIGMPAPRPIFQPGRVNIQRVNAGLDPFNAALLGFVEATRDDDGEKNRLCTPVSINPLVTTFPDQFLQTQKNQMAWRGEPDLSKWLNRTRLSPFRNASRYLQDDPEGQQLVMRLIQSTAPAIENLERILKD